ncbi:MAG: acyl-CoA dehydrogenase N-terminal domain-containing protein, partial [Oceanicaulis sp.]
MPQYRAPLRDHHFVLNDLLNVQQYSDLPSFSEASEDIVSA